MLFVTNDTNCLSYTHHIKELFCSPKEKDLTLPLNLTLMTVIIYTGNKVKSSRGKKRKKASTNFFSFGQQTISMKIYCIQLTLSVKTSQNFVPLQSDRRQVNFIEDTIFPHGSDSLGKECNIALKTSPKGSKTTFLPIKLQQSIIQAAMYAAS